MVMDSQNKQKKTAQGTMSLVLIPSVKIFFHPAPHPLFPQCLREEEVNTTQGLSYALIKRAWLWPTFLPCYDFYERDTIHDWKRQSYQLTVVLHSLISFNFHSISYLIHIQLLQIAFLPVKLSHFAGEMLLTVMTDSHTLYRHIRESVASFIICHTTAKQVSKEYLQNSLWIPGVFSVVFYCV